ncbi:helix-turn-helix domain-containing protein [Polaribacter batillariae]|uniref:Helix-turn-helix domain-containing protein n=1 Tax=Polaribacter batillariae TaxID=2808900 RepID=A0ABX7SUG4_9FLAO|nr:helix-turn-helix domain-containing protein [Polaribacter batillariae]QTD36478.1 helix-turn-helix domain-containing protein [Polaribacter batillariae]
MALPKQIIVKESIKELKSLQKKSKALFIPRLRMLQVIKEHKEPLSKNALAKLVGVNHNSIQRWRTMYLNGGLKGLLAHKTTASAPFMFTKQEREKIYAKLSDPKSGIRGYKELLIWVEEEFGKTVKYNSLMVFCRNQFGTKIKVARKSHIKKDAKAVDTFKKTLVVFANKP